MKKTIVLIFIIPALLLTSCGKEKSDPPKAQVTKAKSPTTPAAIKSTFAPEENVDYCPKVETLVKTNLKWSGPGGWNSDSPSFSEKIIRFEGAQWKGIKNGKVLCIYKGDGDDFPIILQTNRFDVQPTGPTWAQGKTQNRVEIYNCVSTNPGHCPFPKSIKTYEPSPPPEPFEGLEKKVN